ncbi:MAG: choice-of-anchor D domain-containing protein [Phycisphaerae bacterium]|jgi:hypothetical protein
MAIGTETVGASGDPDTAQRAARATSTRRALIRGAGAMVGLFAPASLGAIALNAGSMVSAEQIEVGHSDIAPGGRCISLPELAVMMDADAGVDDVVRVEATGAAQVSARFTIGGTRWTTTATEGAVEEGQRLTITYSFVPDGLALPGALGEPASPSDLFANLDGNFPGGRAAWKDNFRRAFQRWGEIINITYVEVPDDGAAWGQPGLLASGAAVGRGDVRIAMHAIDNAVLAYNYYPAFGGDLVLDSQDVDDFTDPSGDFRFLRNVLMHEHGHGLGLAHSIPADGTKLMQPSATTAFDGPQEDDQRAAQHLYGDPDERNDSLATASFVGGPLRTPAESGTIAFTRNGIALERHGAADFYAFTAFASTPIAVRVDPLGTTYQAGSENGAPATINARAARDLGVRLWRRVSAQSNTFELFAEIDFTEAGESEYHPPVPYIVAGFMVVEVYSTDDVDAPQAYALTISNAAIDAQNLAPAELLVVDGLDEVTDGDTLTFGATETGQSSGKALVVRNSGEQTLNFTGPAPRATIQGPAAADFAITELPAELAGHGQFIWGVTFAPTAVGQRVAVITVPNDDADESGYSFIVSGTAVHTPAPTISLTIEGQTLAAGQVLALPETEIGETFTASFQLRNDGDAPLNVSSIAFAGPAAAEFASDPTSASIASGELTGTITFAPAQAGAREAYFRVASNAGTGLLAVKLTGTGIEPAVEDDTQNAGGDDGTGDPGVADDGAADTGEQDDVQDDTAAGDPNGPANAGGEDADAQDDANDAGADDGFDENASADDAGADAVDSGDEDADANDDLDELNPIVPGPALCGFGAGLSAMLCAASLGVARRRPTGRAGRRAD